MRLGKERGERERETEKDRETDRKRQRQRHRDRDTETEIEIETETEAEKEKGRECREREKLTDSCCTIVDIRKVLGNDGSGLNMNVSDVKLHGLAQGLQCTLPLNVLRNEANSQLVQVVQLKSICDHEKR